VISLVDESGIISPHKRGFREERMIVRGENFFKTLSCFSFLLKNYSTKYGKAHCQYRKLCLAIQRVMFIAQSPIPEKSSGPWTRVSFETIFDPKQPKLNLKLVSTISETKCLFQLFRFYTETESFHVSIDPKQTEDQPKQFDREHFLIFLPKI
jgi:hypothetical protein